MIAIPLAFVFGSILILALFRALAASNDRTFR